jgi:hypothetical protein
MYIKRDSVGKIIAISKVSDKDTEEFLADDAPELQIFLRSLRVYQLQTLAQSDQTMARVVEDVVNILVDKSLIRFTDLPAAAQAKLLIRRHMRGTGGGIDLLDNEDDDLKF